MELTPPRACVLDSFAILAYLKDERGSEWVSTLLERGDRGQTRLSMHTVNLGEVYYAIYRNAGEVRAETAYAKVRAYPIRFLAGVEEELLLTAARLKGKYPLSYADAFAAATAMLLGEPLISGDPEFQALTRENLLTVLWP